MPRNMSFMLTETQIRNKTKTVTRRDGWLFLKPGDIVNACKKCMDLKKGEKLEKITQIQVASIRREPLIDIKQNDVTLEGFPNWTTTQFISMYLKHNGGTPDKLVTRIEFKYIDSSE